jgi:hypothetical protein
MRLDEYKDGELYIRVLPAEQPVTAEQKEGYKFKAKCLEAGIVEDTKGFFHDIRKIEPVNVIHNNN